MSNNIDRQYLELVEYILRFGYTKQDRTGTGTKSIFGWQIRHNMSEGFPLLTTKKMAWKTMVTELLWFLKGDTNIKYLVDNDCHIWDGDCWENYKKQCIIKFQTEPLIAKYAITNKEEFINKIKTDPEFAKQWGELGPIYGKQWRQWQGWMDLNDGDRRGSIWYDQIQTLIYQLKTNPDSRRLMVSAWNVAELEEMVLPPCHYGFQVYTRELTWDERHELAEKTYQIDDTDDVLDRENVPTRAISLMWNQRSVDVGLGLPFNIASYTLLLEIIAKIVNMIPEEVIGNLGDCHIYLNHIDGLKEQLTRTPYELPKLNINTEFWPTESGECGVGLIDAKAVLDSFSNDSFCKCLLEEDIQLYNYQYHPSIKLPLSN